jgi:hypothetical protein
MSRTNLESAPFSGDGGNKQTSITDANVFLLDNPDPVTLQRLNADAQQFSTVHAPVWTSVPGPVRGSVDTSRFFTGCSLHDLVPMRGGGAVLTADGVRVNVGGRAHGGVAEALGDGREVHAVSQQEARVAVSQDVKRGSLGQPRAAAQARNC